MQTNPVHFFLVASVGLLLSCSTNDVAIETLTLEAYTNTLNTVIKLDTSRINAFATARESILDQAEGFRKQYDQLRVLVVPATVATAHADFVSSLKSQYESNLDAGQQTPAGLAATGETINEFSHYRADVGYARDKQSKAGCQLQSLLSQSNLTFRAAGVCGAVNSPRVPDKAAGSREKPVSEVYILHDAIKEANGSFIRPNVDGFDINTIVAKANTPLTITFDNKNPMPFVFSFSIYKGSDETLKGTDFVAGTAAYSGIKAHKLTVILAPGTYTYVDNVHPIAMRGTLTIVP